MTQEEKQSREQQAKDFFLQNLAAFITVEEKKAQIDAKIEMFESDLQILKQIREEL